MADVTNRYSWPYQETTDAPDGPALGQELAEAVEGTVGDIDDRLVAAEADLATAETDINALEARTTGKPLCILRKSTITSIANAGTYLTWDTEDLDRGNMHSTSSNTNRVTPTVAGWYRITATITYASNATGRRGIAIRKNGSSTTWGSTIIAGTGNVTVTVTVTLEANGSTDYFEVFAYQDSGGALNSADTATTRFEVELTS